MLGEAQRSPSEKHRLGSGWVARAIAKSFRGTDSTIQIALDAASTYDVQIDLDVPRTISGHVLFHTRYGHG